jgi:ribose 5-phosphate isomerase A
MLIAMNLKRRAAEAALDYLSNDTVVGLGTGSTAEFFIKWLGEALRSGRLRGIRGLPTSIQAETQARELGIPLVTFAEVKRADVDVDGADEIDPQLNLIKGLGGALLREKIVAQNSDRVIIIADASKRVARLGTKAPVPVEVAMFGHEAQGDFLSSLGCVPTLRRKPDGNLFITDNANVIYDCRFSGIPDPTELESALKRRAGIVESGLFVGVASLALVADDREVQVLTLNR